MISRELIALDGMYTNYNLIYFNMIGCNALFLEINRVSFRYPNPYMIPPCEVLNEDFFV